MLAPITRFSGRRREVGGLLPAALFVLGIAAFAFAYGVLVGTYRYFPYEVLHNAKQAADALSDKHYMEPEPNAFVVDHEKAGVTIYDPDEAFNGYTFLTAYRDGHQKALLIDMRGNVRHEWQTDFSEVWPDAPHIIEQVENDAAIHWHGAHLFENGDVLFNFESGNFPFGGGLVKIDKHSNVLWALERNTHHDLAVTEDGTIYVAAHNYRTAAVASPSFGDLPFYEDVILKVSPEGKVIDEISIVRALQDSDYRNLLPLTYGSDKLVEDPTHLNTVEILPQRLAQKFFMFEPGDILISLRNLNMIGVIDGDKRFVKWALVGMFVRQHDPDFLNNGNIILFDNQGGLPYRKRSRILEINPVTQKVVWRYEGTIENSFFSDIRGKQQVLPNGNVLVTDSQSGRVFEVTRGRKPEIVWEYYNRVPPIDGEPRVGLITLALRIGAEAASFVN